MINYCSFTHLRIYTGLDLGGGKLLKKLQEKRGKMSGGGLTPNVPMSVNSFLPSFGILGSPEPSALNLKNFNNNISENPAAGQAVNHRSLRDYNATGLVNNNISGNPVADM